MAAPAARVFLRANKRKISFFLVVLRAIYTGIKNHPGLFQAPPIDLTVFLAQIDALAAAQLATKSWPRGPASARDAARDVAYTSAETLRTWVQALCDASPEQAVQLAQACGMQLRAPGKASKETLAVTQLGAGVVQLAANASVLTQSKGSRFFNWQYSLDGGKSWLAAPSTNKSKTTISGLPMLTQIRFRVSVTESKTEALGLALEWSNDVPFTLV